MGILNNYSCLRGLRLNNVMSI